MSVGQGVEEGGWGGGKVLGRHCQVRSGEQSSVLYSEVGVEVGGEGGYLELEGDACSSHHQIRG